MLLSINWGPWFGQFFFLPFYIFKPAKAYKESVHPSSCMNYPLHYISFAVQVLTTTSGSGLHGAEACVSTLTNSNSNQKQVFQKQQVIDTNLTEESTNRC